MTSEIMFYRKRLNNIEEEIDYIDDILGHTAGNYDELIAEREELIAKRNELQNRIYKLNDQYNRDMIKVGQED